MEGFKATKQIRVPSYSVDKLPCLEISLHLQNQKTEKNTRCSRQNQTSFSAKECDVNWTCKAPTTWCALQIVASLHRFDCKSSFETTAWNYYLKLLLDLLHRLTTFDYKINSNWLIDILYRLATFYYKIDSNWMIVDKYIPTKFQIWLNSLYTQASAVRII